VDLVDCIKITTEFAAKQSPTELAVGDWTPGRYAWKLENPRPIPLIKLLGQQGLWNAELCANCRHNTAAHVCRPHPRGCDGVSYFESVHEWRRCAICGNPVEPKHEHNSAPVTNGICCERCNAEVVIPARIAASKKEDGT